MDRIKEIITGGGGAIVKIDEWGKRRLAYEIKDSFDGVYYILYFTATPKTLDEVTRVLGITDTALRFMPIKHEKPFAFQQQPAAAPQPRPLRSSTRCAGRARCPGSAPLSRPKKPS